MYNGRKNSDDSGDNKNNNDGNNSNDNNDKNNTLSITHSCILGVKVHHDVLRALERRQSDFGAVLVFHREGRCVRTNLTILCERVHEQPSC